MHNEGEGDAPTDCRSARRRRYRQPAPATGPGFTGPVDLTKLDVNVIVSAANSSLRAG